MTEIVEEPKIGLPSWALDAAWDMPLLLGGLCSSQEARRARRRVRDRRLTEDEEAMQLVRRGMVWLMNSLALILATPGHPTVRPPGSRLILFDDVMTVFTETCPTPPEHHEPVRTVLEHAWLGKGIGVWGGGPEHLISADQMVALGWGLWLLADVNDSAMGRVYYTHGLVVGSVLVAAERGGGQ